MTKSKNIISLQKKKTKESFTTTNNVNVAGPSSTSTKGNHKRLFPSGKRTMVWVSLLVVLLVVSLLFVTTFAPSYKEITTTVPTTTTMNKKQILRKGGGLRTMSKQQHALMAPVQQPMLYQPPLYHQEETTDDGDTFELYQDNPFKRTIEDPVSTFSIDVDTSSYSYARRSMLMNSRLPVPGAIRIEEMVNYFDYDYPTPTNTSVPFEASLMVSPSPFRDGRKLLHVGIKGYNIVDEPDKTRPSSNIVFLMDVSGSMSSRDKLPLAKKAMEMLLNTLQPTDYVSIVTYASETKVVLEPTPTKGQVNKKRILSAIQSLQAAGGTWGQGGIEMAYKVASQNFNSNGINRIILLTDGDFNIGLTGQQDLEKFIETKRETGIFLSVMGFGMGNYRDTTMKALANKGNGVAAYIDSIEEAYKVMVTEVQSTLFTIAKDVKVQIEFNSKVVLEYRLLGYEKRLLQRQDFSNDKVDAGDIGAGHTVTAMYEMVLTSNPDVAALDELRYVTASGLQDAQQQLQDDFNKKQEASTDQFSKEYAFLKIRYKLPNEDSSRLISKPISYDINEENTGEILRQEFHFATAVAIFAKLLKGNRSDVGDLNYDSVIELAEKSKGMDPFGYRQEFVQLVRMAKKLDLKSIHIPIKEKR